MRLGTRQLCGEHARPDAILIPKSGPIFHRQLAPFCSGIDIWAKDKANLTLEIVRRMPWAEGFVVIKRRWVVERTFAWIMKCRRLVRDYEQLPAVAETLILIAAAATLLRRWP